MDGSGEIDFDERGIDIVAVIVTLPARRQIEPRRDVRSARSTCADRPEPQILRTNLPMGRSIGARRRWHVGCNVGEPCPIDGVHFSFRSRPLSSSSHRPAAAIHQRRSPRCRTRRLSRSASSSSPRPAPRVWPTPAIQPAGVASPAPRPRASPPFEPNAATASPMPPSNTASRPDSTCRRARVPNAAAAWPTSATRSVRARQPTSGLLRGASAGEDPPHRIWPPRTVRSCGCGR